MFVSDFIYQHMDQYCTKIPDSTWIIGDVHGCSEPFRAMLEKLTMEYRAERIYQLGDLIDRGPDLYWIFELCDIYGVETFVGNHELKFFQERTIGQYCRSKARQRTHAQFDELSEEKQNVIMSRIGQSHRELFITTQNQQYPFFYLSHAPTLKEYVCGEGSRPANLFCMLPKEKENNPVLSPAIHGHMSWQYRDIHEQIDDPECDVYNIDSGLVFGGSLTAINPNTMEIVQIRK